MRTIKNLSFVLMTAALAVFMTSCQGEGNEAKAVAEKFMTAFMNQDFETAKKHVDDAGATFLDMVAQNAPEMSEEEMPEIGEVKATKVQEDGDMATVTLAMEGEEESIDLKMTKIDGEWKVTNLMEVIMGGQMDMEEDHDHDMEDHDHEMESDTMMMEGDGGESM